MFIAVGNWQFKLLQTQFVKHHIIGFLYLANHFSIYFLSNFPIQ